MCPCSVQACGISSLKELTQNRRWSTSPLWSEYSTIPIESGQISIFLSQVLVLSVITLIVLMLCGCCSVCRYKRSNKQILSYGHGIDMFCQPWSSSTTISIHFQFSLNLTFTNFPDGCVATKKNQEARSPIYKKLSKIFKGIQQELTFESSP